MTDSVAIIRQHAWGRLYNAANAVAARIGADGEIGTRSPEISTLMDALAEIDGGQWCPGIMPYATALPEPAPPAQPADIVNPISQQEPVAWRHSKTGQLYDSEEEVPLADGDEWSEPLYAAPAAQQEPSAWRQWSTKRHDWDYQTNIGDLRPDTPADPLFVAAVQPNAIEQALQKIADFGQDQEWPAPSQAKSLALLDIDCVEHMQGGANGPTIRLRGFINAQTDSTAPQPPIDNAFVAKGCEQFSPPAEPAPVREVRMMEQLALPLPRVLDPCCGSRMWWFDRQHPDAIYGDQREEQHILCDGRTLRIEPDVLLDFRSLPFPDGRFNLVAFDPPHLRHAGKTSWMAAKYGKLGEDWRDDLRQGFAECFRVLASDGVLVFKWNETQVKVREVLALTPEQPLFGNTSGKKAGTHWYVFMKKPPTPKATL